MWKPHFHTPIAPGTGFPQSHSQFSKPCSVSPPCRHLWVHLPRKFYLFVLLSVSVSFSSALLSILLSHRVSVSSAFAILSLPPKDLGLKIHGAKKALGMNEHLSYWFPGQRRTLELWRNIAYCFHLDSSGCFFFLTPAQKQKEKEWKNPSVIPKENLHCEHLSRIINVQNLKVY